MIVLRWWESSSRDMELLLSWCMESASLPRIRAWIHNHDCVLVFIQNFQNRLKEVLWVNRKFDTRKCKIWLINEAFTILMYLKCMVRNIFTDQLSQFEAHQISNVWATIKIVNIFFGKVFMKRGICWIEFISCNKRIKSGSIFRIFLARSWRCYKIIFPLVHCNMVLIFFLLFIFDHRTWSRPSSWS